MAMIKRPSSLFILAICFAAGCSIHEDVVYSAAEVNGVLVAQWPYSNYGIQIHVRADNAQAIHSTSRVLGIPIQTVDGPNVASIRPHAFFIAIKAEPGMSVAWEPTQLVLFHDSMEISLSEISYPKLIGLPLIS